ncbi:hypothetical protein AcV7_006650 [Taiwanofungus camphoratus]|nr:hypothetical protein AcV7_006650 [Antrodia cinnamomea]
MTGRREKGSYLIRYPTLFTVRLPDAVSCTRHSLVHLMRASTSHSWTMSYSSSKGGTLSGDDCHVEDVVGVSTSYGAPGIPSVIAVSKLSPVLYVHMSSTGRSPRSRSTKPFEGTRQISSKGCAILHINTHRGTGYRRVLPSICTAQQQLLTWIMACRLLSY